MATGGFFYSDLFSIYKVVQNTQILFAKELIVGQLREFFAKDSNYHYVADDYGHPKVIDMTDVPSNAGLQDELSTRIYIGQEEKVDVPFLPSVLVKHTGATYKPISFNQENKCLQKEARLFIDGYGRHYTTYVPKYFIFAGAWDTNFDIDVITESTQDRSTIVEAIAMLFQTISYFDMMYAGLFIKSTRVGGESKEDYVNDKIFRQTISLECRGEYRRIVPIESVVDVIDVCVEFGNIQTNTFAENMRFNYQFDLLDIPV
ncbi:MAG TPA: hypothetical protein VMX17_07585 [Candidatus Glassbacteria bacterium]|nr:hypothetical protein [Candidatus Glassbacteria bacterium]